MQEWEYQKARDLNLNFWQKLNSLNRELSFLNYCSNIFWNLICRIYLKLFHRLRIIGLEKIPKNTPFILVANHSSHLDTLCLLSTLNLKLTPAVLPIAAADYFFNKKSKSFFSSLLINALPLWRKKADLALENLEVLRERILEGHCGYIIFPEGSRSRDGQISNFKAGVAVILAETSIPLIPCYIKGTFAAYPAGAKFPRPQDIEVYVGNPLTFENFSNNKDTWKKISKIIHQEVIKLKNAFG